MVSKLNLLNKLIIGILLFCVISFGLLVYKRLHRYRSIISILKSELRETTICHNMAAEERDWLIREIHHRVKNNMQIVLSLINTQSTYLKNPEAIKAIQNCKHRMFAISLVHQKLYQADSLADVDMVVYTHEMLEYLLDEFKKDTHKIGFKVEMVPLSLDVNMAVPFGLIINETISNVLKFAFPKDLDGIVKIDLQSPDGISYTLKINDNGIGLNNPGNLSGSRSFGTNLMAGLANQLGGSYKMENNNGVEIQISFSKKERDGFTGQR